MKTLNKIALVFAAGLVATGCVKNEEPTTPNIQPEGRTITVVVDNNDSRVTFTDGEGFAWEGADAALFRISDDRAIGNGVALNNATSLTIGDDSKATFTFDGVVGENGYFLYAGNWSQVWDNRREVRFDAEQVQTNPGVMNKEQVILVSDYMDITSGEVSPKMNVLGSVLRFNIYSSTGEYADEKIISISVDTNNTGTHIVGTCGIGTEAQPIQISGVNADSVYPYWDGNWGSVARVSVTNRSAVTATSKDTTRGHGIYVSIAPATASFTYKITTDKAVYTVNELSDKAYEGGTLYNLFINLESVAISRLGNDEVGDAVLRMNYQAQQNVNYEKHDLYLGALSLTLNGAAVSITKFVDDCVRLYTEGGDWFTASFVNHDDYNTLIHVNVNTTAVRRTGKMYIEYNYNGTWIRTENYVEVNQDPGTGLPYVKPVLVKNYDTEITVGGETVANAASLSLVDENNTTIDFATYKSHVTLSINHGATATLNDNGTISITFPENENNTKAHYTLTATGTYNGSATLQFTQEAAAGGETPTLKYGYTIVKAAADAVGTHLGFGVNPNGGVGTYVRIENVYLLSDESKTFINLQQNHDVRDEVLASAVQCLVGDYDFPSDIGTREKTTDKIVPDYSYTDPFSVGVGPRVLEGNTVTRFTWFGSDGEEAGYFWVYGNN